MGTPSLSPIYARDAASIAFPKKPVIKMLLLKLFSREALIPPKTESRAARIATERYAEYTTGIL
jgi:hypothetical protein